MTSWLPLCRPFHLSPHWHCVLSRVSSISSSSFTSKKTLPTVPFLQLAPKPGSPSPGHRRRTVQAVYRTVYSIPLEDTLPADFTVALLYPPSTGRSRGQCCQTIVLRRPSPPVEVQIPSSIYQFTIVLPLLPTSQTTFLHQRLLASISSAATHSRDSKRVYRPSCAFCLM
jgi:hypothetical protein